MKPYDPKSFTWGYELEIGDVARNLVIPNHLGTWEHAETDVINVFPPYQYVACDPLGLEPPVGGEVNMVPTRTWQAQVEKTTELLTWLRLQGQQPSTCCTSHNHVHVHVPGLTGDIAGLKRLTKYIKENQKQTVTSCYPFQDDQDMNKVPGSRAYFKYDGGRLMPDYMSNNILSMATDFESFIRIQCCGKDGVSRCRPFRYAINTYCLKHTDTIEFRCFRSSLDLKEISSCFKFVERFMDAALNNGPSVPEIIQEGFTFPAFRFSLEECLGWVKTRWSKERGKKQRQYLPVG